MLEGIVLAIILAILLFFRRSWWPHGAVLGRTEGIGGWHSIRDYPDSRQIDGIVVFRWEAPLFFANSGQFRRQIQSIVLESHPRWIVLQCEAMTDIDVTAAEVLRELDKDLNADGIHLAFVEMRSRLQDLVVRYGLIDTLDRDHFYPSIEDALADIEATGETEAG